MSTLSPTRAPRQRLVGAGEIDHHVSDMSATADAAMTLDQVQAKLAFAGQWLPIDGQGGETLAELVLRNSTGPLRLGYGAWRDLLLGTQFTDGQGRLVTAGGRTVKNVAGYDLTKFIVGSFGIFAAPETFTFRTYRRPTAAVIAVFPSVYGIVGDLLPTDLRPQWMALSDDGLACGYLGDERLARFYREALQQLHEPRPTSLTPMPIEQDIIIRAALWQPGDFRLALPPAEVTTAMSDLRPRRWVADPVHGIIVGEHQNVEAIESLARRLGGTAWTRGESGGIRHLAMDSATAEVVRQLKRHFDPDNNLNRLPIHLLG